jgi:GNAT superfamily N-acetyltransferase
MTLDADSAASSQDAAAIAALDVARRRAAYRDLRPAAFLASLSVDEQTARWSASLPRETSRGKRTSVAEAPAGTVLGYAKVGPEAATCGGMLLLMYVTPDAWGTGAGRELMGAVEDALRGLRHRTAGCGRWRGTRAPGGFMRREAGGRTVRGRTPSMAASR